MKIMEIGSMMKWALASACLAIAGTACAEEVGEFSLVCRAKLETLPTVRKGDGYRPFWVFGDGAWELRLVWNSANGAVQSVKPTKENAALVHAYGGEILTYAFPQSGAKDDARAYRLCYGFGDWLNDYDGFSLYCWDEFSGNPWNEFENWGGKSYIYVFPTADGVVDTPSWEGQREAVDDVRYTTLLRMMDDPEANAWLDSLDPFAPGFDPSKCRAEIIDRILALRARRPAR